MNILYPTNLPPEAMRELLYPTNLPPEANVVWRYITIVADGVVAMALASRREEGWFNSTSRHYRLS